MMLAVGGWRWRHGSALGVRCYVRGDCVVCAGAGRRLGLGDGESRGARQCESV